MRGSNRSQDAQIQRQEVIADRDEIGVDMITPSGKDSAQERDEDPADEEPGKRSTVLGYELGLMSDGVNLPNNIG